MSASAPSFAAYLACDLPYGYPFEPTLTEQSLPQLKERHRKLIVAQQAEFQQAAQQLLLSHPWLAYIAALKDDALLTFVPIETTPFVNVVDQKAFKDLHENWRLLRNASRAASEDGIAFFCERLVQLQREAALIAEVEDVLRTAQKVGFTALLPISVEPPTEVPEDEIRQWHRQDGYIQLIERPFHRITSLPPDTRHHGLKDLATCLEALAGLREEKEVLVANYITPYFE